MNPTTTKRLFTLIALLLLATLPAAAQSGCIDSPENPTAVLFLVGTAGFMASGVRSRVAARRAARAHNKTASASSETVS